MNMKLAIAIIYVVGGILTIKTAVYLMYGWSKRDAPSQYTDSKYSLRDEPHYDDILLGVGAAMFLWPLVWVGKLIVIVTTIHRTRWEEAWRKRNGE